MGLVGVGPYDLKEGDLCVALFGGELPFILRDETDEQALIGDCYVHGIMNGELDCLLDAQTDSIQERQFVIH